MGANEKEKEIKFVVSGIIQEAYELLSGTICATKGADEKAKRQGVNWTDRHRLHVLLEAAEDSITALPHAVVAPWFLAELRATLDVVRRWRGKSCWREIEPSLKDPKHFAHSIAMLHVAEHLEKDGHKVDIVRVGKNASPDLMLRAIGGSQDWVVIECYQPSALCGKPSDLSLEGAEKIVEKSMDKAKRQLGTKTPGIVAICGYNQSSKSVETLRQAAESRLSKTARPNLCGIWLIMLGVLFSAYGDRRSFSATLSAKFVPNPSYFGRVDIEAKVPNSRLDLIKAPFIDINTDSLASGGISPVPTSSVGSVTARKERPPVTRVTRLNIVEEPQPLSRSVVHGAGNKVPPLFIGGGNIDGLCGQCGAVLAKQVWGASISNIIVECPVCQSYNEFPVLPDSGYDKVQLTTGNYNFSDAVKLRRGVRLEGK